MEEEKKPAGDHASAPAPDRATQDVRADEAARVVTAASLTPGTFRVGHALSDEQWQKEFQNNGLRWKDSPLGRLGIRTVSRGLFGAAAFTWASYYSGAKMVGYTPHGKVQNWVQGIARAYDVLAGVPIKKAVTLLGMDGEKFLTFRPTQTYTGYKGFGRSLGHEVIGVTFDFGAMSIGDFWGRKLADAVDPNVKLDWVNNDGSINPSKAASNFVKNWWTAITYSAGEDWAVAVPYVLTMRHIGTPAINKIFPGYLQDYDRNGNGGSLLVNNAGKITGNLTMAGVMNLWERFTTYNVGTLMFREMYAWTGDKLKYTMNTGKLPNLIDTDPGAPVRTGSETVAHAASQFGHWMARDVLKGTMYMLPAVPFFWASRVPQHKYRGYFINAEKGALTYGPQRKPLRVNSMVSDPEFNHLTEVYFGKTNERAINPFSAKGFDPHAKTYGMMDTLLTPIGRASDAVHSLFSPLTNWLERNHTWVNNNLGMNLDVSLQGKARLKGGAAVTHTYTNAAIAYTPYFWAKSDMLSNYWDTGRTDVSLDRIVDGALARNWSEVKAGANETWHSITGRPLPARERELEAQCRIASDISPHDSEYEVNAPTPHARCNTFTGRLQPKAESFTPQSDPRRNALLERKKRAANFVELYAQNKRFQNFIDMESPSPERH